MTNQALHHSILAGRSAIEYCMLKVVIRPRAMKDADNAELNALTILLRQFNQLMNRHMQYQCATTPANDDK